MKFAFQAEGGGLPKTSSGTYYLVFYVRVYAFVQVRCFFTRLSIEMLGFPLVWEELLPQWVPRDRPDPCALTLSVRGPVPVSLGRRSLISTGSLMIDKQSDASDVKPNPWPQVVVAVVVMALVVIALVLGLEAAAALGVASAAGYIAVRIARGLR